jgi:hypothetical protein
MKSWVVIALDFFAVLFQLLAAWMSYKIYSFNRLSKWWLALVVAFIVQASRRGFQIFYDLSDTNMHILLDRSLMFLISLLLFLGLWSMLKNFENFDIVQKKVNNFVGKTDRLKNKRDSKNKR